MALAADAGLWFSYSGSAEQQEEVCATAGADMKAFSEE